MIKVRLNTGLTMPMFLIVVSLLLSSAILIQLAMTTTIIIKRSYGQNESSSNTSSRNSTSSSNTNNSTFKSSTSSSLSPSSQSQTSNANYKNTNTADSSSNYLTYDNSVLGIRMQYPANWSVREYAYNKSAAFNVVAGFYSTSKTGSQLGNISGVSGNFVPYLDILVFATNGISLDDIVNERVNNFLNNPDFAINNNESKPFILNSNHPARMLDYTVTIGGDEFFRKRQAWTIFDDKVYVITFTSQQVLFPNNIQTAEKMINSFEIQTK
jgi:photosystem II reaction center protein PsbP